MKNLNQFKAFEINKANITGGKIESYTINELTLEACHTDNWYLFKCNNPVKDGTHTEYLSNPTCESWA